MKEVEKVCSAERLRDILKLTTQNMYDRFIKSINLSLAKQNAIKVYEMHPAPEELGYIRESDGVSLLHLAIFSHNPYLVALYRHLGLDPDFHKFEGGITPRSLISKTGHLVNVMKVAFSAPDNFLRDTGILKDFTVETRGRFKIRMPDKYEDEEFTKLKEVANVPPEVLPRSDVSVLTLEEQAEVLNEIFNSILREEGSEVAIKLTDETLSLPGESSGTHEA